MNISEWFNLLCNQILATGWLEWVAVLFGVGEVLLARKNMVLLYPVGIVSILTSAFLLIDAKLYAETLLSMYYLVMSIYGWAMWKSRSKTAANSITKSSKTEVQITVCIAFLGWGFLYLVLKNFTDSDVPIMDAFVSSTAWAGMWLLAKRKLENWIWLNISNIVAIPLLFHKNLAMFALLTLFLFLIAILGYFDWKKILKKNSQYDLSLKGV